MKGFAAAGANIFRITVPDYIPPKPVPLFLNFVPRHFLTPMGMMMSFLAFYHHGKIFSSA